MLRKFSIIVFTVFICHSAYGQADPHATQGPCSSDLLKLVSEHLKIKEVSFDDDSRPKISNEVIANACKRWPSDKSLMIVSFAYDSGIEYQKQLVVSLVDIVKGQVAATYKGIIGEDATLTIGQGSLRLDTARYDLAPGIRAFGLDFSTIYSQGCVEGGIGPYRTLFIREGKTIRPVLEGLVLSTWTFLKGGPSCASDEREVAIETTGYTITVLNTVSNGFRDLRITGTSSMDSAEKSLKKPVAYLVKYNGKIYPTEHIGW